jgi:hypothetical protein
VKHGGERFCSVIVGRVSSTHSLEQWSFVCPSARHVCAPVSGLLSYREYRLKPALHGAVVVVISSGPAKYADPVSISRRDSVRAVLLLYGSLGTASKHQLVAPKNTSSRAKARQRVSTKDRQGKDIV